MRRARVTYSGAYHHVMNRGYEGKVIFESRQLKDLFLQLLEEKSLKYRISILAYCVMDTHYHLVLQNSSGKLSEFMKQLNGGFGMFYRKRNGGKGYVFQSRFKSTLVQEDEYLRMSLIYLLMNPVRAGLVTNPYDYGWSSVNEYFGVGKLLFLNREIVEEMFGDAENMKKEMRIRSGKELPVKTGREGEFPGTREYWKKSREKHNRREEEMYSDRQRQHDYIFQRKDIVIEEFEKKIGMTLEEIDTAAGTGKKLRNKLLVLLKDEAGMKYREIIKIPLFHKLKLSSLGKMYELGKKD